MRIDVIFMSYKKYLLDYSVEEYVDDKGRTKKRAVYIAGSYILSPAIPMGEKYLMLAATIISWLSLIGAFFPRTHASELAYVILPFVFTLLPLYYMTGAIVTLLLESEQLTRERADKIVKRLPPCSLISAVLLAAAFIGLAITAIISRDGMLAGDILFGALSLVASVAEAFIYIKCRGLKAYKAEDS